MASRIEPLDIARAMRDDVALAALCDDRPLPCIGDYSRAIAASRHRGFRPSDRAANLRSRLAAIAHQSPIADGLFYLALGAIAATTLGLLIMWCQS